MTILFDNYGHETTCKTLWGFSAYFEEYGLLFDTGSNGRVLLKNMEKLGLHVEDIKYLFISHSHWDHTGGIDSVLELNSDITLFVPSSLSKNFTSDLKSLTRDVVVCGNKPQRLFDDLYTTVVLGEEMPEHSLIVLDDCPKLVTGCGHFGIENIIKSAREFTCKDIEFAIGGFHMYENTEEEILESIKELKAMGVSKVMPTHCTGDEAIALFRENFGEGFFEGGVGKCLNL